MTRTRIADVRLRRVLDSRGSATVEADVLTEGGGFGRAAAPSGASTGAHEAIERPAGEAIAAARDAAVPRLTGVSAADQRAVDAALGGADGTGDFSKIGANAAVALSVAAAKAGADSLGQPLYQHLGGAFRGDSFPTPLGNVLGGGEHATDAIAIQEILAIPTGAPSASDAVFATAAVHERVGDRLRERGYAPAKGDEGAWAPSMNDADALGVVAEAAKVVADEMGIDIRLGLDVAAAELYDADDGVYVYPDTERTPEEQAGFVADLIAEYDLVYVEDPLDEDDFDGFGALAERVGATPGSEPIVCGDDLYVTDVDRIERGVETGAGNAVLIKPNQIGTLSGAVDAIELATRNGFVPVVSHRSGETEDTTIAHLAVATGAPYIKTGAVGGERTAKLNELLRIEDDAL